MLCYYCNQNEADNRFVINYNGQLVEVRLCTECTERLKRYVDTMFHEYRNSWMRFAQSGNGAPPQEPVRTPGADSFPLDAGDAVKKRRRLAELRAKLQGAVDAEDYEAAVELRDEIFRQEKGVCIHDK